MPSKLFDVTRLDISGLFVTGSGRTFWSFSSLDLPWNIPYIQEPVASRSSFEVEINGVTFPRFVFVL